MKFCGHESSLICFRCKFLDWPILPTKGIPARPLTPAETVDRFFCTCATTGERIIRVPENCPDFSEKLSSFWKRVFGF
jgi:hypothetical protein